MHRPLIRKPCTRTQQTVSTAEPWLPLSGLLQPSEFVSDYSCLFGISEPIEGLPAGESNIIIGNTKASYLAFIGMGGEVYWLMYHKMSSKHQWPDSPRFSKEDAELLANTHLKDKMTETVTFEDVWKKRKTSTLLPMDEGVLDTWHWGRFVTEGDSTHKVGCYSVSGA